MSFDDWNLGAEDRGAETIGAGIHRDRDRAVRTAPRSLDRRFEVDRREEHVDVEHGRGALAHGQGVRAGCLAREGSKRRQRSPARFQHRFAFERDRRDRQRELSRLRPSAK